MFPIFLTTGSDATFGIIGTILPFALVLVVMYFLMIRPQKKKDKQLQDLRN